MVNVAAMYCRLSREDEKTGESGSISTQKSILTEYAEKNNFAIYKTYVDDGYSGTTFERPGFQAMLKDAEDKKFNIILVKDLSRFGRNYIQTGMYTEEYFPERNIRVIAINDNFDSEKGDNEFAPFKNIINEWYTKDISKKIRVTHKLHQERGVIPTGKLPLYGYMYDEARNRIPDPDTAPVVKLVLEMYVNGATRKELCQTLKKRKFVVPGYHYYLKYDYYAHKYALYTDEEKYNWTESMVENIIGSNEYNGDLYLAKSYVKSFKIKKDIRRTREEQQYFPHKYEGIVSDEIQKKVIEIRNLRVRDVSKANDNIYKGIIKCYTCGENLGFRTLKNKKKQVYYGLGCRNPLCKEHTFIRLEDLEELVDMEIKTLSLIVENEECFSKYVRDYFDKHIVDENVVDNSKEIAELRTKNLKLEKLIQKLFEESFDNSIPKAAYDRMLSKYKTEFEENQKKLDSLIKVEVPNEIDKLELAKSFIYSIKELLNGKSKAKLLSVFKLISIYKRKGQKGKVKFNYGDLGPLVEVFKNGFIKKQS